MKKLLTNRIFLAILAMVFGLATGQLVYRAEIMYKAKHNKIDNIQYKISQGIEEKSPITNVERVGDNLTVDTTIGNSKKTLTFKESSKAGSAKDNRGLCVVTYLSNDEKPYMTYIQAYVGDADKGEDMLFNVHLYIPERYKK